MGGVPKMLQLIELYQSTFVGEMFPERLLEILKGYDPIIKVKDVKNGITMLTNGRILKCTGECYEKPNSIKNVKSNNIVIACRNVRRNLQLEDVDDFSCVACHIKCLEMLQDHSLIKRRNKRKKGTLNDKKRVS